MTLVAEVRELDDTIEARPVARLLVTGRGGIEVVELRPRGAALAHNLLAEPLVDPFGQTVTSADGADFLRTLRWARSNDLLWVTPLTELPDDQARDPATEVPFAGIPHVPATVPYPDPPAALSGVRVVEIRRPATEDYCRTEVMARLVGGPGGPPTVEGADEADVRRLLNLESLPPLDELDGAVLAPGLIALAVRFDRPGDLAWRNGLVRARSAAVAAGDHSAVARLDLEFTTRLPRIWSSRCPFTGEVLRLAIDGWGFDSPFWDQAAPVRPLEDHLPATFLGLAGAEVDETTPQPPPVFAAVVDDPDVRAVLSAVHVGDRRCDLVAYFTRTRSAGPPAFREWGTHLARTPDGPGWRWTPRPDPDPPVTTELEPLLRSGQLAWIEPSDTGVELHFGPEGCPWL
jgi:hypothetical protein